MFDNVCSKIELKIVHDEGKQADIGCVKVWFICEIIMIYCHASRLNDYLMRFVLIDFFKYEIPNWGDI